MKRILIITSVIALVMVFNNESAFSQTTNKFFGLDQGKHMVGFRNYTKSDPSRTYRRIYDWNNKVLSRPISISIWYPSKASAEKAPMFVKDYMTILKQEEEWETLPNERILGWFSYQDNDHNRKNLTIKTNALKDAPVHQGKFPVIIYAPSYQASSVENFVLCEYLASHGYIVLSSPSRGTENRFLDGGTTRDIETQARDIEFLIAEALLQPHTDPEKIATIGFSFGGISNVLAQMRNDKIKALVCLDGSVKYKLEKLLSSSYADVSKVDVPFLFMSQKDIPKQVLIEDKIDSTLNTNFAFFDSLKNNEAYHLKFNHLTHAYFSSLGVLFQDRDPRQDKSDQQIVASYRWVNLYCLNFLNAILKGDQSSKAFITAEPTKNGVADGVILIQTKKARPRSITFQDFNELAGKQKYRDLEALHSKLKREHKDFQLEEWKLNNLGLQLLFGGKKDEAINTLTLATILFPKSANAFDTLGEAYFELNNSQLAVINFKRSLALDASNQNAINRIKQLSKK